MGMAFTRRSGDRRPSLRFQLLDVDGDFLDLTSAVSVTINVRMASGAQTVLITGGLCTIELPTTDGICHYDFTSGDNTTLVPGSYQWEAVVTWSTGITQTHPNGTNEYATITTSTQIA